MSLIKRVLFIRGLKSAFACAMCAGGLVGYFLPYSFIFIFGWKVEGTGIPILSLVGLGIFCGGYSIYGYLTKSKHLWLPEVLVIAGMFTDIVFIHNIDMGYKFGMLVLILFAFSAFLFGMYARFGSPFKDMRKDGE